MLSPKALPRHSATPRRSFNTKKNTRPFPSPRTKLSKGNRRLYVRNNNVVRNQGLRGLRGSPYPGNQAHGEDYLHPRRIWCVVWGERNSEDERRSSEYER